MEKKGFGCKNETRNSPFNYTSHIQSISYIDQKQYELCTVYTHLVTMTNRSHISNGIVMRWYAFLMEQATGTRVLNSHSHTHNAINTANNIRGHRRSTAINEHPPKKVDEMNVSFQRIL